MKKPMWNSEAVKAYETGQGVELVTTPHPQYRPLSKKIESQEKTVKVEGPLHVVCQCDKCKQLEEQAYDLLGQLKVANLKLSVRSQRTWVDLTNEQFAEILCDDRWQMRPELMLLACQAKLKEMNT